MRLRQVALVAHDLEAVVADLCALLSIEVAFRDPGVGVGGFDVAVKDRRRVLDAARQRSLCIDADQVMICGTRIRLVAA